MVDVSRWLDLEKSGLGKEHKCGVLFVCVIRGVVD